MLRRKYFQPRQLAALEAIFEAADALTDREAPTTHARVYQLAGTSMSDLQIGVALTLAARRTWHTLVIYPEALQATVPPLIPRAAMLDPDYRTGSLADTLAWRPGQFTRPYVTICSAAQLAEALRPPKREDDEGDGAAPRAEARRVPSADEFDLLILHDPNERVRQDFGFALDHFTGARLAVRWMSAKADSLFPPGSVKTGVITLNVQAALAAAS